MKRISDAIKRSRAGIADPQRIISLLPSATETVCALGHATA